MWLCDRSDPVWFLSDSGAGGYMWIRGDRNEAKALPRLGVKRWRLGAHSLTGGAWEHTLGYTGCLEILEISWNFVVASGKMYNPVLYFIVCLLSVLCLRRVYCDKTPY